MGLPQGLVTQSSACVPTQGWGCTWGGSSREDSLCPRPGLGVPAGLSREEGLRPPPRGWGCPRACPEKRVCVPAPRLVGHIWGLSREEGMGGAAEVGSSPQVAVGPWA